MSPQWEQTYRCNSEYYFKVPEHAFLHRVTDMKYEMLDSLKQRKHKGSFQGI